jgi:hypothetical protein
MKSYLALVLILTTIGGHAIAYTIIPGGAVSGVWTLAGSPYQVQGNINIPAGANLTIEPGVTVQLYTHDLDIYGSLHVRGQLTLPVNIQGTEDFIFHSSNLTSRIVHCNMATMGIHAGGASGIQIAYSQVRQIAGGSNWTVKGCTISSSLSGNAEYLWTWAVTGATGDFINNNLSVSISGGPNTYMAEAYDFSNCSGTFEGNTLYAYASTSLGRPVNSGGFGQGSGICRKNTITAGSFGLLDFSGNIANCTIIHNSVPWTNYGIYGQTVQPASVVNCIIIGFSTGLAGTFEVRYSDIYNCGQAFGSGIILGPGIYQVNPLLGSVASPCIDSGDPTSPHDPDSTRADMGVQYYDQSNLPVDVALIPATLPLIIPANGGSFNFEVSGMRHTGSQIPLTLWVRLKYPDGSYTDPVLGPISFIPPENLIVTRLRTQSLPGAWPPGTYTYLGYANALYMYPAVDSSFFTLTKSATARNGGPTVWETSCTGAPFPDEVALLGSGTTPTTALESPTSSRVARGRLFCKDLVSVSPNPFNPTTSIVNNLPTASQVSLKVYDITGRLVATLFEGWEEAGSHYAIFDGSKLASGIYLARLEAGESSSIQKIVLLK